jgi:hypothetical protein
MALGTGPQRLLELFEDKWQATRTGRGDIPDIIKRKTQGEDETLNSGVVAYRDREKVGIDHARHDTIHCYHPEANPPTSEDRGFKEEQLVETVQVDVSVTDRTDHSRPAGEQRLAAKERMVGDRGYLSSFDMPPYPGIMGEVKYILEGVRRGLDEWDTVSHDFVNVYLGNSNADVSVSVELEQIARNTVQ